MLDLPIWWIEAISSFFRDILIINNCYLQFHKTYGHQNWTAGTSNQMWKLIQVRDTNQAQTYAKNIDDNDDTIIAR